MSCKDKIVTYYSQFDFGIAEYIKVKKGIYVNVRISDIKYYVFSFYNIFSCLGRVLIGRWSVQEPCSLFEKKWTF